MKKCGKTIDDWAIDLLELAYVNENGLEAEDQSSLNLVHVIGTALDDDFQLHGDSDEFGAIENVRRLVDQVAQNTDAELVVFENCGHFFDEHLSELRDVVRDWTLKNI